MTLGRRARCLIGIGLALVATALALTSAANAQQPSVLTGTVTDSVTNLPVEAVCVHAIDGLGLSIDTLTDVAGTYTIFDLAPGPYSLRADDCNTGRYSSTTSDPIPITGGTTTVDLVLEPLGAIAGVVRDRGYPAEGVCLAVDDMPRGLTGTGGTFTIDGLVAGRHLLVIAGCPSNDAYMRVLLEVVIEPGQVTDLGDIQIEARSREPMVEIEDRTDTPLVPLVPAPPAQGTLPVTGPRLDLVLLSACLISIGVVLRRAEKVWRS